MFFSDINYWTFESYRLRILHSYSFHLDDGISIPCSYTSYVAPLQSLQIYNETRRSKDVVSGWLLWFVSKFLDIMKSSKYYCYYSV